MPFPRPTLQQLIDRNEGEVAARLGTGPLLRRSVLSVLARVVAGASHEQHGHLDWLARNLLPDQAEREELERWATLFNLSRKPAAFAEGPVEFSGSDGSLIPTGTLVRRQDGARFATLGDATVAAGVATATVRAELAGTAGNSPTDTVLRLVSPVAGVANLVEVVDPGVSGGTELEDDEALRARVLQRAANHPQAGAERDYVRWALEVQGVTRAWAFRNGLGIGTVAVAIATDDDLGAPTPSPAKVAEVAAYIEDGRRPVTAQVFVFGPLLFPVDLDIQLTPDDAPTRAEVSAQLVDLFRRAAVPGQPVRLSHLHEAISTAAGELDHSIVSPTADVVVPTFALPVLGAITWS